MRDEHFRRSAENSIELAIFTRSATNTTNERTVQQFEKEQSSITMFQIPFSGDFGTKRGRISLGNELISFFSLIAEIILHAHLFFTQSEWMREREKVKLSSMFFVSL